MQHVRVAFADFFQRGLVLSHRLAEHARVHVRIGEMQPVLNRVDNLELFLELAQLGVRIDHLLELPTGARRRRAALHLWQDLSDEIGGAADHGHEDDEPYPQHRPARAHHVHDKSHLQGDDE